MKNNLKDYTPNFISLSEWTPLWESASEFFIKPRVGRGGRGCRVVSRDELIFLKEKSTTPADFVVMEVLPGTEWTVDVYIGKTRQIVYIVVRESLGLAGGISIKGRTVHHKELIQKTKELLTKLEVSGPACIQWKADSAGVPRFVEINPRFSGGLMISVAAGVDPAAAIVADIEKVDLDEQSWNETTVIGYLEYSELKS
jgi:carbamoyl-phosphate synthase large subunit